MSVEVLLVEDNPGDACILSELLRQAQPGCAVQWAEDGIVATQLLHERAGSGASLPDLVLLDLNLPRKSGREVLKEIREDRSLARLPVIVLTTSNSPYDRDASQALKANKFITKPGGLEEYEALVNELVTKLFPELLGAATGGADGTRP